MQNGKGDKIRPFDINRFNDGYDAINWHRNDDMNYNAKADREACVCKTCRFLSMNICKCIESVHNDHTIEFPENSYCKYWASKKVSLKK